MSMRDKTQDWLFPPPLLPPENGPKLQSPPGVVLWIRRLCPPKIRVETFIPNLTVFGSGASGR